MSQPLSEEIHEDPVATLAALYGEDPKTFTEWVTAVDSTLRRVQAGILIPAPIDDFLGPENAIHARFYSPKYSEQIPGLPARRCHSNVASAYEHFRQEGGNPVEIVTGYAFYPTPSKTGLWLRHSWLYSRRPRPTIRETCRLATLYWGVILGETEADLFCQQATLLPCQDDPETLDQS